MSSSGLTVLSALLFVAGVQIYKAMYRKTVSMGLFSSLAFTSLLLSTAYGVAYYFTGAGIDQATCYHLTYALSGAAFSKYTPLIITAISALLLVALYVLWPTSQQNNRLRPRILTSLLPFFLLSVSLLLLPPSQDIYNRRSTTLTAIEPLPSQISRDFNAYYRTPAITPSGDDHKNIVVTYAESVERTYFDETLVPGLIKGLRELESLVGMSCCRSRTRVVSNGMGFV